MTADKLLLGAEQFMVSEASGLFGTKINYKHKRGAIVLGIPCQVSNSDTRQGTSKSVHDETIFYSMTLGFEPKENDEIHYDNDVFIVKRFTKSRGGSEAIYDVVTLSHQALKHRRDK